MRDCGRVPVLPANACLGMRGTSVACIALIRHIPHTLHSIIMSRPATIFTGLLVSGAILYQFRTELTSDMRQVRNQLTDVQNRLAGSVPGNKISNVNAALLLEESRCTGGEEGYCNDNRKDFVL